MIAGTGLTKLYGSKPAAQALDFEIARGVIVGLLGLNGAGKTTVLRILACQLLPTSGRATVDGHDIVSESVEVRRRVGYLLSESRTLSDMERPLSRPRSFVEEAEGARRDRFDDVVADLHLWRVGPKNLAAIVSIVSHDPHPPEYYREVVSERFSLAHVTVEVNRCPTGDAS